MNAFDSAVLFFLNDFARKSWTFDSLVLLVADSALLKGGVLVALLWWSWERTGAGLHWPSVARTLAGALAAIVAGRALQLSLPARLRPLQDPGLAAAGFEMPYALEANPLRDVSSFPSDHAVLAFALATAVFLAHRGAGVFAYGWALVVACLPRVYMGFHHPTDILGGAAVGVAVMLVAARLPAPGRLGHAAAGLVHAHRGLSYAGLFLLSFEIATYFLGTRNLLDAAKYVSSVMLSRV